MHNNFKVGVSVVQVYKLHVNETTRRQEVVGIHKGIVVQNCGSFVRVYNPAKPALGGDASPESSEFFAVKSPRIWCTLVEERKFPFQIPGALQF